ncbi:16296_t:CDS:2, partial [Cetraspora pellucida]
TTGALIFAERYEGEANQYDVNSMYIFEIIKKDASWPIAPATIEGNPPKKSLQCMRYLCYNSHRIYIHYNLECVQKNGLKVTLMNISQNALIYEKNVRITRKDMFGEWASARKRILEIVKLLGDQVKCIHTDGFIIAGKVELKMGIEVGKLKFEKNE